MASCPRVGGAANALDEAAAQCRHSGQHATDARGIAVSFHDHLHPLWGGPQRCQSAGLPGGYTAGHAVDSMAGLFPHHARSERRSTTPTSDSCKATFRNRIDAQEPQTVVGRLVGSGPGSHGIRSRPIDDRPRIAIDQHAFFVGSTQGIAKPTVSLRCRPTRTVSIHGDRVNHTFSARVVARYSATKGDVLLHGTTCARTLAPQLEGDL